MSKDYLINMMLGMPLLESVPKFGVCCFSKSWQGARNWKEHALTQGICVGFETVSEKLEGALEQYLKDLKQQYTGEIFRVNESDYFSNLRFIFLLNVKYEDNPDYRVNIIPWDTVGDRGLMNAFKKDKGKYVYEDEVRSFVFEKDIPNNKQFRCDEGIKLHARCGSIKEVTFAQDISDASKNKVIEQLKSHRQCVDTIKFYKCTGVDKEGKMQREPI